MSKICKKRVHGNDKKNLPWDFKRCPGSLHFTLLPNPQEIADLVKFTEEILDGKLQFLCSDSRGKGEVGTSSHYLLHCSNYSEEWLALVNTIKKYWHVYLQQTDSKFISISLFGDTSFGNNKNAPKKHWAFSEETQIWKIRFFWNELIEKKFFFCHFKRSLFTIFLKISTPVFTFYFWLINLSRKL